MKQNSVWRFFASVKLALISLIVLAVASIAGTLIKQRQDPSFYVQEYGPSLARFIEVLDLGNMYSSWWYIALLGVFALNLIVCSLDRLPYAWRQVKMDNLVAKPEQLKKKAFVRDLEQDLPAASVLEKLPEALTNAGWKKPQQTSLPAEDGKGEAWLFFAQKAAWSRLAVYVVHLSILVILGGAMVGSIFGFQAYVFIPEGKAAGHVFLRENKEPYALDFKVRCDRFEKTFYGNGMIKQFHADLTVLDPGREIPLQKTVVVNDPLDYGGLTFYIGDSYPMEAFYLVLRDRQAGLEQAFRIPAEQNAVWPGTGISFLIGDLQVDDEGAVRQARIRLSEESSGHTEQLWIGDKNTTAVHLGGRELSLSFRQLHSTLFLVTKDPGLWVVYTGFITMMAGLGLCFFLSHRRIWVYLAPLGKNRSRILVSGGANKHKPAFQKQFDRLVADLEGFRLHTEGGKKKQKQ